MSLPLTGIRVVDLGRAFAGPSAAMWLADFGADVIKIESGPKGDNLRYQHPIYEEGIGGYFCTGNRNKRSLHIDLRAPGGQKVLRKLLSGADVLVENFRPGVLEAMGLDDDTLKRDFPKVIALRISAYGNIGPMAQRAGVDQLIQGISGLMATTGTVESGPTRSGIAMTDVIGGLVGAMGVLAALMERQTSDQGQTVRTSLLEGALSTMSVQAGKYFSTGVDSEPAANHHPGAALYGLFHTSDGHIQVHMTRNDHLLAFLEACGRADLMDDPRFETHATRAKHRVAVNEIAAELFKQRTTADWVSFFLENDIPHGEILTVAEAFTQPQAEALQMTQTMQVGGDVEVKVPRPPWRFSRTPIGLRHPVPTLGQHTGELLDELGLADDDEVRAALEF